MNSTDKNPYVILNVKPDASLEMIEKAYRRLALRYHPDLNTARDATLQMQRINAAYTLLQSLQGKENPSSAAAAQPTGRQKTSAAASSSPHPTPQPPRQPAGSKQNEAQGTRQAVEQMVIFYLDEQSYGFSIHDVESVLNACSINRHPHAPAFIDGITVLRGKQTPIIDLRRHLGLPDQPATRDTRTILVRLGETPLGFIVDSVDHYLQIPSSARFAPPSFPFSQTQEFIQGFVRVGFQLVIVLSLSGLLNPKQIAYLDGFYGYINRI